MLLREADLPLYEQRNGMFRIQQMTSMSLQRGFTLGVRVPGAHGHTKLTLHQWLPSPCLLNLNDEFQRQ